MTFAQRLFRRLIPEQGTESEDGTPPAQRSRSFLIFVAGAFLTKAGDALVNPKITLTWLLNSLGAPSAIISLLVPVRESLSMLPQLWFADPVNAVADRRRIWQLSTALQGLSALAMALVAATAEGWLAGVLILGLLILFSLARCLASLVSKAVLAEQMPKTLRGQTTGWGSSGAGLALLLVGLGLFAVSGEQPQAAVIVVLLFAAAGAWCLATVLYGQLPPRTGVTRPTSENTLSRRIEAARADPDFVRFVGTRALLMSSALVAPYFLLLDGSGESALHALAGLIVANAMASFVSAPFWGQFSDRSSRQVLRLAGSLVASVGAAAVIIVWLAPSLLDSLWLVPGLYFLLEISHQGVRIGRKTYLVDFASDEKRVDYVAVCNTAIGALLLLAGLALSALSTLFPTVMIIALLSLLSLSGAWLGKGLPEVQSEKG